MRLLSIGRNTVFHDNQSNRDLLYHLDDTETDLKKYKLEYLLPLRELLDKMYFDKIKKVNKDFIANNEKSNFTILFNIYKATDDKAKKDIVKDYYDFIVRKADKNVGFSIKKLREYMLEIDGAQILKDKQYDSVRGKMYTLLDFIIYRYYKEGEKESGLITEFVESLRFTEDDKENIYIKNAEKLWRAIGIRVKNELLQYMNPEAIKDSKTKIDKKWLEGILANENISYFSKYIYFLTMFLDGKEINELTSVLIDKFENIYSFIDLFENINDFTQCKETDVKKLFAAYFKHKESSENEGLGLKDEYKILRNSGDIAKELKTIKSISKMEFAELNYTWEQYYEAARILGTGKSGDEEIAYVKEMYYGTKDDRNLRNFIGNNVLNSNRFKYLVKYCNVSKCREVAQNESLVRYVIGELPDTQIDRYYNYIGLNGDTDINNKKDAITKKITGLNFADFVDVQQKAKPGTKQAIEKEQKKAFLNLYLTVIYLVYKNMININSRYVIAYHCFERDTQLHNININGKKNYCDLTNKFIDKNYINKHASKCLKINVANSTDYISNEYFNCIRHMSAVTNLNLYVKKAYKIERYFDLYHYSLQMCLIEKYKKDVNNNNSYVNVNEKITKCFENVESMHSYNKDLLNILNAPIGYCLPRCKNLSIRDKFDKNEQKKTKNRKN